MTATAERHRAGEPNPERNNATAVYALACSGLVVVALILGRRPLAYLSGMGLLAGRFREAAGALLHSSAGPVLELMWSRGCEFAQCVEPGTCRAPVAAAAAGVGGWL